MYKPKCILLKLLNTPDLVKVRIICSRCRGMPKYCVVQRTDNVLGWEMVEKFDDLEKAFECLGRFYDKRILYK